MSNSTSVTSSFLCALRIKSFIKPIIKPFASLGKLLPILIALSGSMSNESVAQPLAANFGWDTSTTCLGDSTLFIDSTQYGTLPYTYSWNFGDSGTADTSNMASPYYVYSDTGDFNVRLIVMDNLSVIDSIILTINIASCCAIIPYPMGVDESCVGACDGIAYVDPTDGVLPYTYLWDDPSASTYDSAAFLCAGTYNVTITDSLGCVEFASVMIYSPPGIYTDSTFGSPALCNGSCDGIAAVSMSGGSPYTYLWDDPGSSTNDSAVGLCAGMYHVTVTDTSGCWVVDSFLVTEPSPVITSANGSPTLCAGYCDGSASANASGGVPPLTYTWDDPGSQTTDYAIGLCAGIYHVTVMDFNGCSAIDSFNVTEPPVLTAAPTSIAASCNGACDGMAIANASGGTPPISLNWDDPGFQTTDSAIGLCAMMYQVTITDYNGCSDTDSVQVTEPAPFTAYAGTDAVICEGSSHTLSGSIGGGASSLIWSSMGSGSFDNVVLAGATYTPSATDIVGGSVLLIITTDDPDGGGPCMAGMDTVLLTINPAATVSAGLDSAICEGSTYSLMGTMGGSASSITWTTSGTGTFDNINLVGAMYTPSAADILGGTVTLTITSNDPDGAGPCSAASDFMILNIDPVATASAGADATICEGANHTLSGSIGGSATSVTWTSSGSGTFDDFTLLSAIYTPSPGDIAGGTVMLTITTDDPAGPCFAASDLMTLTINPAATVSAGLDSAICEGSTYSLMGTMGGSASSITWTTSGTGTFDNINLVGAIYTPSAVDILGVTVTLTITSNDPDGAGPCLAASDLMTLTIDPVPTASAGVDATICGGVNYTLSGNIGGSATSATWTSSGTGTFDDLTLLSATYTPSPTDIAIGTVTLTITTDDPAGPCFAASDLMTLTIDAAPTVAAAGADQSLCNVTTTTLGGNTPTVGTGNWTLVTGTASITTPSSPTSGVTGLTIGTSATLRWTISNGICVSSQDDVIISVDVMPSTALAGPDQTLCNVTFVTLAANSPVVGTGTWSVISGTAAITTPSSPTSGVTSLTIGGTSMLLWNISNGTCPSSVDTVAIASNQVATANAGLDANICGGGTYMLSGAFGGSASSINWTTSGDGTFDDPTLLSATYTPGPADISIGSVPLTITTDDPLGPCLAVSDTMLLTINQITSTSSGTATSCNGSCDGDATVAPSGGILPYSYLWNDPGFQSTATAIGLCAGQYNVTITDSSGCTAVDSFTVTEPGAMFLAASSMNATCGNPDGQASVMVTGGSPPYLFSWNDPALQTTDTAIALFAGVYTVQVTDNSGCIDSVTANVNDLGAPTAMLTDSTDIACNGDSTGNATVVATGGSPPYSYLWSDAGAQTNTMATSLAAGVYSVTVTDNLGCAASASVTLIEPLALFASITASTNVNCNASCNGDATVYVSGGTGAYAYLWNDPGLQTNATAVGLCAGTYSVAVTDSLGCTSTDSITITEPPALVTATVGTNANCNGSCDGSASTAPSGGTGPYAYLWSNSTTTNSITGLCAGIYTVNISDANGCSTNDTVIISEPPAITTITSGIDASCNGTCDGSASTGPSGGTGPYAYLWNNASTSSSTLSLCAGVYTVTITDAGGCTLIDSTIISEQTALVLTTASVNSTCGSSNGLASVSVTGGTAPYLYVWDDLGSQTGDIATFLFSGPFNVIVTDNAGCSDSASVVVNDTGGPILNMTDSTDITCFGGADGSATVTASGGTLPYTYLWDDPGLQSNAIAVGLFAGSYTVAVSDSNGCSSGVSVALSEPTLLNVLISASTDPSCGGSCDGTATVTASGGSGSFVYLWDDPGAQTTATAIALCAGTYTVQVTDSNGCTGSDSITIIDPAGLVTTSSSTAVSCFGSCDGIASTSPSGGTGVYNYSWSNGGNSAVISALCAGTYTVVISDSFGCSTNDTTIVTEPSPIVLSTTSIDASCGNPDGNATVNTSGGTGPYNYMWDDPGAQTNATANSLTAGSYSVVVTDAMGCSDTAGAIVNDAGAPTATMTDSVDVSCNGGADGSATVAATGGTAPYTYSWDDPGAQTNAQALGLSSGVYTVLIADALGCTTGLSVTISEPAALLPSVTGTSVTGCSNNDGTADATVSGGVPPYLYSWSSGDTTQNVSGLVAGTHTVTILDANSCSTVDSITLGQIPTLTVTISGTNVTSCGLSDGTSTVATTGGAAPISISWSTGDTTLSVSGLGAGLVSVQVMDTTGCLASTNLLITEPPALTTSIVGTNLSSCGAGDGAADLTVAGGNTPFNYIWSTGDTTEDVNGLPSGMHSVTMIDANGCTASESVTLTEPAAFTTSVTGTDATCNLGTDGFANLTTTGGVAPFDYNWSNGDLLEDIGGLTAGLYTVNITDANGCSASDSVVISEPSAAVLTFTVQDASGCGTTDGTASVSIAGGTAPFGYVWSNGDTLSSAAALGPGTHHLTLTDASECIIYGTFNINAVTGPSVTVDNVTNVTCAGAADGSIDVTVTGGNLPYTFTWTHGALTEDVFGLQGTFYELTVTDTLGCVASASATVNEPSPINVQVFITDASCNAADGDAEVFVAGGVAPYSYQWSTFGTTTSQSGLNAGSYTVNITDANGCEALRNLAINSLGGPTITLDSIKHVNCDSTSNGLLELSVNGGNAPYSYTWSTGDTTEDLYNLIDTTYSIVVSDVNGCSAADNFQILYQAPQEVKICIITVDSATGKNMIVWEKPTGPSSIENYFVYKEHTQAGVYFLLGVVPFDSLSVFVDVLSDPGQRSWRYKITAGDSCLSGTEGELSPLHKTIHLTINQGLNGEINLAWDKYDGFFISTYVISRGTTMANLDSIGTVPSSANSFTDVNPPVGSSLFYQVAAIHPQGCLADKTKNFNSSKSNTSAISPSAAMSIDVTGQDVSFGNCDGVATATVLAGGQQPFTYLWNDPSAQTTASATGLCIGNYSVLITDAIGDTISGNASIGTLPGVLELTAGESISAFPNPYTGQTTITYSLLKDTYISVQVYDVLGKRVAVLADESQQAGTYSYVFGSESGQNPNGVYFVKVLANNKLYTKRIVELK